MPNWKEYTRKLDPDSADEIMILDTEGGANKRVILSDLAEILSQFLKINRTIALDGENVDIDTLIEKLYIKYRKDSTANVGKDCLRFRIRFLESEE